MPATVKPARHLIGVQIRCGKGNVSLGNHIHAQRRAAAGRAADHAAAGRPAARIMSGGVLTPDCCLPPSRQKPGSGCAGHAQGQPGPPRLPDPLTVTLRVSVREAIMIGGSRFRPAWRMPARPPGSPWKPAPAASPPGPPSPSPRRGLAAATSGGTRHRTTVPGHCPGRPEALAVFLSAPSPGGPPVCSAGLVGRSAPPVRRGAGRPRHGRDRAPGPAGGHGYQP